MPIDCRDRPSPHSDEVESDTMVGAPVVYGE